MRSSPRPACRCGRPAPSPAPVESTPSGWPAPRIIFRPCWTSLSEAQARANIDGVVLPAHVPDPDPPGMVEPGLLEAEHGQLGAVVAQRLLQRRQRVALLSPEEPGRLRVPGDLAQASAGGLAGAEGNVEG